MTNTASPHQPQILQTDSISPERLDPEALKVIHRLKHFHFEAYLVGGCVRDLMLGLNPKDFDVATSAHPRQVKRLFRNCRIIGRRFKLAHIVYGQKIIETATFRKEPDAENRGEDLLIKSDNLFGNAEEDARRRDFTINALFYDPETHQVIDYVGGIPDIESRTLRTIGDPVIRFREDPVRILRAVKFAARLGFKIEENVYKAMKEVVGDLVKSAPPRILEEILRLLKSGHAQAAFRQLREIGALGIVLPEVEQYLQSKETPEQNQNGHVDLFWKYLEALDSLVQTGETPSPALALASIYFPLFQEKRDAASHPSVDLSLLAADVITPLAKRTRLSRFESGRFQRICIAQRRFTQKPGRRFRPNLFVRQDYFFEALQLFRLHCQASNRDSELLARWEQRLAERGSK